MAPFSAWPICNAPVTFEGGKTMQYGSFSGFGSASNTPRRSHSVYQRPSTVRWSYVFGICALLKEFSGGLFFVVGVLLGACYKGRLNTVLHRIDVDDALVHVRAARELVHRGKKGRLEDAP